MLQKIYISTVVFLFFIGNIGAQKPVSLAKASPETLAAYELYLHWYRYSSHQNNSKDLIDYQKMYPSQALLDSLKSIQQDFLSKESTIFSRNSVDKFYIKVYQGYNTFLDENGEEDVHKKKAFDKSFEKFLKKYNLQISAAIVGTSNNPETALTLECPYAINLNLLADSLSQKFGLASVVAPYPYREETQKIGASSGTIVQYDPNTREVTLTYWSGWGDCPAGCINKSYINKRYNIDTKVIKEEQVGSDYDEGLPILEKPKHIDGIKE